MRTAHHESLFQKLYNFFKLSIPACIRHHGPGLPPEVPGGRARPFPGHGSPMIMVGLCCSFKCRAWPLGCGTGRRSLPSTAPGQSGRDQDG